MRNILTLIALAGLAVTPAWAAETSGFYIGADIGQANSDVKKGDADSFVMSAFDLTGLQVLSSSSSLDKSDTTYGLFVGYQFMPYLAAELGYLGTGKTNYKSTLSVTDGTTTTDVDVKLDWEAKGPVLSALGILPFADAWQVFARVGVFFADTKLNAKATSGGVSRSDDVSKNTEEFIWGVGGGYTFGERWLVRLEYQGLPNVGDKNHTGEANVDRLTLGLLYKF